MKTKIALTTIVSILFIPGLIFAQAQSDEETTTQETEMFRFGVGFQGTFPATGLSGVMSITDDIAVQAIAGFFGTLRTFAGRGLYKFQQEEYWDLYGYGMIGAWSYKGFTTTQSRKTETVLGLGVGGGFQYDWRAFNATLPPIAWNLELGVGYVDFNEVNYSFSTIMIGAGIHYRF